MQLTRLQKLAEAGQSPSDAAAGLRAVVEDAIADLQDKLGANGALARLLKDAGLAGKDTIKDADGKTILERLAIRTKQYAEEVERLLTEAEVMVATAAEKKEPVAEGRVPGAEEQRTRKLMDRIIAAADTLDGLATGEVLKGILKAREFPETESKALREAAAAALREAEDLQQALLSGYDAAADDQRG